MVAAQPQEKGRNHLSDTILHFLSVFYDRRGGDLLGLEDGVDELVYGAHPWNILRIVRLLLILQLYVCQLQAMSFDGAFWCGVYIRIWDGVLR